MLGEPSPPWASTAALHPLPASQSARSIREGSGHSWGSLWPQSCPWADSGALQPSAYPARKAAALEAGRTRNPLVQSLLKGQDKNCQYSGAQSNPGITGSFEKLGPRTLGCVPNPNQKEHTVFLSRGKAGPDEPRLYCLLHPHSGAPALTTLNFTHHTQLSSPLPLNSKGSSLDRPAHIASAAAASAGRLHLPHLT